MHIFIYSAPVAMNDESICQILSVKDINIVSFESMYL